MTGEELRSIRKKQGMSQEEFGKAIGLAKSSISNMEKGIRGIRRNYVELINRLFPSDSAFSNVTTEKLIEELENRGGRVKFIPKLCEILGVDPYEEFYYNLEKEIYIVNNAGRLMFWRESDKSFYYPTTDVICDMIEHPELIRKKV